MADLASDTPLLFQTLGRRGAAVRFGHEITRALAGDVSRDRVLMSRQSDGFSELVASIGTDGPLVGTDVFQHDFEAILASWRIFGLRNRIGDLIRERRVAAVVDLMPHVWSPMLVGAIQRAGARYVAVAHDLMPHPGDGTALAARWSETTIARADHVLTLSDAVTRRALDAGIPRDRVTCLFHPTFAFAPPRRRRLVQGQSLRALFLGRIMPYKGLDLLAEAVTSLRASGVAIELMVHGEGDLSAVRPVLDAVGADIVNRWLQDDEVAVALERADVLVLSHVEASQSGLVAAAHGAGLPVVATPVGALPEQIRDGVDGLLADAPTAAALEHALGRLARDPELFATLADGAFARSEARSMRAFIAAVRQVVTRLAATG
jgi:glycosyltransferase involved in cell wall biosynthesis